MMRREIHTIYNHLSPVLIKCPNQTLLSNDTEKNRGGRKESLSASFPKHSYHSQIDPSCPLPSLLPRTLPLSPTPSPSVHYSATPPLTCGLDQQKHHHLPLSHCCQSLCWSIIVQRIVPQEDSADVAWRLHSSAAGSSLRRVLILYRRQVSSSVSYWGCGV